MSSINPHGLSLRLLYWNTNTDFFSFCRVFKDRSGSHWFAVEVHKNAFQSAQILPQTANMDFNGLRTSDSFSSCSAILTSPSLPFLLLWCSHVPLRSTGQERKSGWGEKVGTLSFQWFWIVSPDCVPAQRFLHLLWWSRWAGKFNFLHCTGGLYKRTCCRFQLGLWARPGRPPADLVLITPAPSVAYHVEMRLGVFGEGEAEAHDCHKRLNMSPGFT